MCKRIQNEAYFQGKIQQALPASQLFSAMPPLEAVKVIVSIMMSVSLSNKWETIEVETDLAAEHISKEQPRDSTSTQQKIVIPMATSAKYERCKKKLAIGQERDKLKTLPMIWQFDLCEH